MPHVVLPVTISLQGSLANKHRLPAYAAGEAVSGFARAYELSLFYLAEERVRHRNPLNPAFRVDYIASKEGSFEYLFELVAQSDQFAGLALSITGSGIYDFAKLMLSKVTGREIDVTTPEVRQLVAFRGGDLEALADAIEPSARRFHQPIGPGANQIVVVNGDGNTINFDGATKAFVHSSRVEPEVGAKVFSIGSFSVNSGYGRAFDRDEGRTIPFQVLPNAQQGTKAVIAGSLKRYASADDPWIELTYRNILAPNGKVKKLLVSDASEVTE